MVLKKKWVIAGLAMLAVAPLASQADSSTDSDMFTLKLRITDGATGLPHYVGGIDTKEKGRTVGRLLDLSEDKSLIQNEHLEKTPCLVEALDKITGQLKGLQPDWVAAKTSYAAAKDAKIPGCGKAFPTTYQIEAVINMNVRDLHLTVNGPGNHPIPNPNYGKADTYNVSFFAKSVAKDGSVRYLPISSDHLPKNEPDEPVVYSGLSSDQAGSCPNIATLPNRLKMANLQAATNTAIRNSIKNCDAADSTMSKLDGLLHVPVDTDTSGTDEDGTIKMDPKGWDKAGKPD